MKNIKTVGLVLFLIALGIFTSLLFIGKYQLTETTFNSFVENKGIKSELFKKEINEKVIGIEFPSQFSISTAIINGLENANKIHKETQEWDNVIWDKPHNLAYELVKPSGKGIVYENKGLFWLLTFGLGILGMLLFILPNVILLGKPGIKNDGIFQSKATNRGWIGILSFIYLVSFYILLYFKPDYVVNWTYILDPISTALSGNLASQWFVYGFLYCTAMTVMAVRMYIKYRHNKYQIVRTTSVLFFQIGFAFLLPEILVRFNQPYYDFKNAFPLDYDFFFDWNLNSLIASGNMGIFILVWGISLTLIIVPIFVYFFGKRWYCSWVCGCGGLAETLGDPYRQLSSKKMIAWKIERWLIHGVLVFALLMTVFTLYSFFTGVDTLLGIKTKDVEYYYGFLIGSVFAGVIGTGFYPVLGNRVWCRFGCPLAAYMGLVQRFKSRFRITTNGGQCISCGNCSTYCEMGIDVRAYAQKGENIIRSSCVGCGVCAAVCPRGVLKLENGPEEGRIKSVDIPLGNSVDLIKMMNERNKAS
ncbi:MAG: FeS-binding protein [Bacteroidetes bacterium HGW-Bacteroidetes-12]|nr:MAG: FeS-binding protein [Bacteroidetes bacterium HGW-Bacteroidetes-12]